MAIPLAYTVRNLWARRLTTIFTISGMGLVVFVFAAILMLAEGLQKALIETGSFDNAVVIRKGSNSEVMSGVERGQAAILETLPEIAIGPNGQRLLAKEIVILVALSKVGSTNPSNVVIRGIGESSLRLRPQVRLSRGRLARFGTSEVMVGESIARRFQGVGLNETLAFSTRKWTVVGIFEAGNTAFSSEIWADAERQKI